MAEQLKGSED